MMHGCARRNEALAVVDALTLPLDALLTSGGDPRLEIAPGEGMNRYGCRASPRPEAITFSSSTATSISERAFQQAAHARDVLVRETLAFGPESAFLRAAARLRADFMRLLRLHETEATAIFSPSGTDAQLLAVAISRTVLGGPLTSIVIGCDQTGSGGALSAYGRHFSDWTAHGTVVAKGAPIAGLEGIRAVGVPFLSADGRRRSDEDMDAAVWEAVTDATARGDKVILFTMDSSKLGRRSPSDSSLRAIRARWPGSVQVAVDACQFRLGRGRIASLLGLGCMVLLTGSKFFTGPPFSGAVLVPGDISQRLATAEVLPAGLRDYTGASDWPERWAMPRRSLPLRMNVGQWLRWIASLTEMRAYYAAPHSFRASALERFATHAPHILARSRSIEPLEMPDNGDASGDEFASRTIVPFVIRRNGQKLSQEQCAALYAMLNRDVSHLLPAGATARQRALAARPCHVGQPVLVPDRGDAAAALRVSAGARFVSGNWRPDRDAAMRAVDRELDEIATVVAKIELLLDCQ